MMILLTKKKERKSKKSEIVLTIELIDEFMKSVLETKSTKSMKKLVLAYQSACNFQEGEEIAEEDEETKKVQNPYKVKSSEVFNHLMMNGITEFPYLFHSLFGIESSHVEDEIKMEKKQRKKNIEARKMEQFTIHH